MTAARTFLWLPERSAEAADFYAATVPGASIDGRHAFTGPDGSTVTVIDLTIGGTPFTIMDAGGQQDRPNTTFSIMITVADQAELDRVWDAFLAAGAQEMDCGWLVDQFGVCWQVVPQAYFDAVEAGRLQQANETLWTGGARINVEKMEQAARG